MSIEVQTSSNYLDFISKEEVQDIRNCALVLYSFLHAYEPNDSKKLYDLRIGICTVYDSYQQEFITLRHLIFAFKDYLHVNQVLLGTLKDILASASKAIAKLEMQMIQRQINASC